MMRKRVLVVDDDPEILDMLRLHLEREDMEVVTAEKGEDALEILRKDNIQVQVLDLQLPGMNGIRLCKKIREDYPIAIIIAITGYAS
ncbi:response regulator, partial [bacterium]|nr:response regulator [bacterium]